MRGLREVGGSVVKLRHRYVFAPPMCGSAICGDTVSLVRRCGHAAKKARVSVSKHASRNLAMLLLHTPYILLSGVLRAVLGQRTPLLGTWYGVCACMHGSGVIFFFRAEN